HTSFSRDWSSDVCSSDLLVLDETGEAAGTVAALLIFNADGSEVEQCGNGARCFARFVQDKRLTAKSRIEVETAAGRITLHVRRGDRKSVVEGKRVRRTGG